MGGKGEACRGAPIGERASRWALVAPGRTAAPHGRLREAPLSLDSLPHHVALPTCYDAAPTPAFRPPSPQLPTLRQYPQGFVSGQPLATRLGGHSLSVKYSV